MQDQSQHMIALAKANRIRLARAQLKRLIAAGEHTVASVLNPTVAIPRHCVTMPVGELLQAQRHWGPTRTEKLLHRLAIQELRPIGNLTPRQRALLIEAVNGQVRDERLLAA